VKTTDIHWLAGVIEGEGCIGLKRSLYPLITVGMTDLDVVQRIHALWGDRKNQISTCKRDRPKGWKQMYYVSIHGSRAIGWLMTLYPLLGERRKAKAKEVIGVWRNHTAKRLRRKSNP
jgi:hypothetical protein